MLTKNMVEQKTVPIGKMSSVSPHNYEPPDPQANEIKVTLEDSFS